MKKRSVWFLTAAFSLSLFLSSANLALATDPLEVGPDVYKKLFENERVRVMEINFKPGDKIGEHSHPDHFVYVLNPGKLTISHADGSSKEVDAQEGQILWMNAESHSAENTGTTDVRALVVEIK